MFKNIFWRKDTLRGETDFPERSEPWRIPRVIEQQSKREL
jgi:hypothetical protein